MLVLSPIECCSTSMIRTSSVAFLKPLIPTLNPASLYRQSPSKPTAHNPMRCRQFSFAIPHFSGLSVAFTGRLKIECTVCLNLVYLFAKRIIIDVSIDECEIKLYLFIKILIFDMFGKGH